MSPEHRLSGPVVLLVLEWRDYHIARLRGARTHMEKQVIGLEIFGEPSDRAYYVWHSADRSGVDVRTLFPSHSRKDLLRDRRKVRRAVRRQLDRIQPGIVIVTGYSEYSMRVAAKWASEEDVPCILLSSSTARDRPRRLPVEMLKGRWLRTHFDAAFTSGSRSAAYLAGLGFPADRIWRGYGVVDNEAFSAGVAAYHSHTVGGDAARERRRFLFVGRLAPEKNVSLLLQAYSLYKHSGQFSDWGLTVVGDGPLKSELQLEAERRDLDDVEWVGFRSGAGLHECYARAGALVLPSLSEPWGLVVNEALASHLPVLVSDRCGCVPELVRTGATGYVFDPTDARQLADQMASIRRGAIDRDELLRDADRVLSLHSPDSWGRSLAACAETVCGREIASE